MEASWSREFDGKCEKPIDAGEFAGEFAGQLMWRLESANEMRRLRFLPEFLDLDKDEIEE